MSGRKRWPSFAAPTVGDVFAGELRAVVARAGLTARDVQRDGTRWSRRQARRWLKRGGTPTMDDAFVACQVAGVEASDLLARAIREHQRRATVQF